jgi:hypothetical protein
VAYDLVFWKEVEGSDASPEDVYSALCEGRAVPQLVPIDPEPMLALVCAAFQGCERRNSTAGGEIIWQSVEGPRFGFQLFWDERHVNIRCQHVPDDLMNSMIDAALAIGCPLYDPQTKRRFDDRPPRKRPEEAARAKRLANPIAVAVDSLGWVKCPNCSRRFKSSDANVFAGGVHLKCSQRLVLVR